MVILQRSRSNTFMAGGEEFVPLAHCFGPALFPGSSGSSFDSTGHG